METKERKTNQTKATAKTKPTSHKPTSHKPTKPTSHKPTKEMVFTIIHCAKNQITFTEYNNTKIFKAFPNDILFYGTAKQAKTEILAYAERIKGK